jgi:hypothetical protein
MIRVTFAVATLLSIISSAAADGILKHEPKSLVPGTTVYVDNGRCSPGKILKVTAAFKGSSRRKACIYIDPKEAVLSETEKKIER